MTNLIKELAINRQFYAAITQYYEELIMALNEYEEAVNA